jgi:hypothetical protein
LKTRSSARTVLVHPKLIKFGLHHYIDKVRRDAGEKAWLFPQVAPNVHGGLKAWGKWFNRHLRAIGISDGRKVFHSFRHIWNIVKRLQRPKRKPLVMTKDHISLSDLIWGFGCRRSRFTESRWHSCLRLVANLPYAATSPPSLGPYAL